MPEGDGDGHVLYLWAWRDAQGAAEAMCCYLWRDAQGAAEAARRSAGPADRASGQPPVVRWKRTQDDTRGAYWTRNSDGWWFCEGDEAWQQFWIHGFGPCWWHKKQGMWFVAKDGLDRGKWCDL